MPSLLRARGSIALSARVVRADEPPAPEVPAFALAGPAGFGTSSADGAYPLLFHWFLQSDSQTFLGTPPSGVAARYTFVVRFAGMQMDAVILDRFHSQIVADSSQSKLSLYDAWVGFSLARHSSHIATTAQWPGRLLRRAASADSSPT